MNNFNSQVRIRLGKDLNGNPVNMSGADFINTLEVHKDPSLCTNGAKPITLTADSYIARLPVSTVPSHPIYIHGGSNANGMLDGSPIFSGGATIGIGSLTTVVIGGAVRNICPVLDKSYNEVITPNNTNIVYAMFNTSAVEGDLPSDTNMQVSFCTVNSNGSYQPFELPVGDYYLEPNLVYNFGYARKYNLSGGDGGGASSMAGESSSEELMVTIGKALKDIPSYTKFTLSEDAQLSPTEGFKVDVNIKEDGTVLPTFVISGYSSGVVTPAGATLVTDRLNIRAKTGMGYLSNVYFLINGVKVDNDKVSITNNNGMFTLTFDNPAVGGQMSNVLSNEDVIEVAYVVPWEPKTVPPLNQFLIGYTVESNGTITTTITTSAHKVGRMSGKLSWYDSTDTFIEDMTFSNLSTGISQTVLVGTSIGTTINAGSNYVKVSVTTTYEDDTELTEHLTIFN